jgi:hypothetical protein
MVVSTLLCGDLLRSHCHIFTAYWGCGLEATEIPILRRRVTLLGESPRKYHRIDLSELNLAYEGLLLGMRARVHRDSNTEAHPHIRILMNLHFMTTAATHLHLFRRIKSSTRRTLVWIGQRIPGAGGGHVGGRLRAGGLKMAMDHGEDH